MASPINVKITDKHGQIIRGTQEQYGEKDVIIGYSFEHQVKYFMEMVNENGDNGVRHHPATFLKEVDNTTPILNQNLVNGDELKEVQFTFYRHDGKGSDVKYFSITMENALIVDISPFSKMAFLEENEPYRLMEHVQFTYKRSTWEWHEDATVIMAMDEVVDLVVEESEPEESSYDYHMARLKKQHPFAPEHALWEIARRDAFQDKMWAEIERRHENQHWVELEYLYPDNTPVEDIDYYVKLSDGREETGTLNRNTRLYFDQLPEGEVSVEFGKPVDNDLYEVRTSIKEALDGILEAKRTENEKVLAELKEKDLFEKIGVYASAGGDGAWGGIKGVGNAIGAVLKVAWIFNPVNIAGDALTSTYKSFQNGEESEGSWKERFVKEWSAERHEDYVSALGFDPTEITREQIAEAYELAALIYDDGPTYNMLLLFAKDYVEELNRLDVAELAGGAVFEIILGIILAALTGGTSVVAQFGQKSQTLVRKLSPLFRKLFKLLKKQKLHRKFKTVVNKKVIEKLKIPDGPLLPVARAKEALKEAKNLRLQTDPTGSTLGMGGGNIKVVKKKALNNNNGNPNLIPDVDTTKISKKIADIPNGKYDYLFGKAKGTKNAGHNKARTNQNALQMKRLGVPDTVEGQTLIRDHLDKVIQNDSNIIDRFKNKYGVYEVRESLFKGPSGKFSKFESTWEIVSNNSRRLTTIIPYGGL